jgi:general secretion pathway protein B
VSYILEALKKSQHERELGHVPTLETPTFLSFEESARPSFWILLAIVLAAVAVVVAFYSILRGGERALAPVAVVTETSRIAAPEKTEQEPDTPVQTQPEQLTPDLPKMAPFESGPRQPAGTSLESEPRRRTAPEVAGAPPRAPVHSRAREREASTEAQTPADFGQEWSSRVPPDLIADIAKFKREVREEESGLTASGKDGQTIGLQQLRLPKDVRERLPNFSMSAHIYDKEPSKRFVLINGLKTREGESSPEDIAVEQILPQGAVLSFEGHRFFQARR